jgi:hypothetical protein
MFHEILVDIVLKLLADHGSGTYVANAILTSGTMAAADGTLRRRLTLKFCKP